MDLNLVELLIDGEGDAGFDVAVDVILHPGTVDPPNWLQLDQGIKDQGSRNKDQMLQLEKKKQLSMINWTINDPPIGSESGIKSMDQVITILIQ